MRIPGFAGEVLAKLGAKPTNIPPGELYTALERGTIDALEWVGPSLDLRMGFQKVVPYYYTGWHEPGTELQYMINKKSWDKLPADLQAILTTAMRLSAYDMLIHSYHESAKNLATMMEEHPDLKVLHFPEDVIQAMQVATNELIMKMAAKDPLSKEILDSLAAYEKISRQWTGISDNAYVNNVSPEIVEGMKKIGQ